MTLKYQVETLDGLSDDQKKLYEQKDGKFVLKIDGMPAPKDTSELEKRLEKLEQNNRDLLDEKKKAKDDAAKAALEAAKASGNVAEVEKSWQSKYDSGLAAKDAEIASRDEEIRALTVGSLSTQIAAELFGDNAAVMQHHVTSRLQVERADGKVKVRVLGEDGKPSALTVDEFKAQVKADKRFAPFLLGSKGSGGGAPNGNGGGQTKKFAEYTGAELKEIRAKNPAEYDRLLAEHKKTA